MSENGDVDLTRFEPVLELYQGGGRDRLLPLLHEAQRTYGYIPEPVAARIGQALGVPLADVYGVVEFYHMYTTAPQGRTVVHVCTDPTCSALGGQEVLRAACRRLGVQPGETTPDGAYTVRRATCLGLCDHGPAAWVQQREAGAEFQLARVSPGALDDLLAGRGAAHSIAAVGAPRLMTRRIGAMDPLDLDAFARMDGFAALRRALTEMTPEQVIEEIKTSGLKGRGGAAFPSGMKLQFTRSAPGTPKYVVANADESEPGTFKDRVLMEGDPFRLIEGLALSAYAIGAEHGYIFIRGEYPRAYRTLRAAIQKAEAAGYLGANILGSGFNFTVEIRQGAGAYVCGEETALFEAIEGKRGYPRIKPPFPTTNGLFDKPTAINNVETLCAMPEIVLHGGAWYLQIGEGARHGTKLFCVSGHVKQPGVVEAPFGIRLSRLIDEYCGGVDGELQAVLMGGAAGTFLTPDQFDTPLNADELKAVGASLGSGAVMVFNTAVDLRDVLERLGHFFMEESCGKCYPCQLGTMRQYEILKRIAAGGLLPGDRERLMDIGLTMSDASLCGLGMSASWAVRSALQHWPELVEVGVKG